MEMATRRRFRTIRKTFFISSDVCDRAPKMSFHAIHEFVKDDPGMFVRNRPRKCEGSEELPGNYSKPLDVVWYNISHKDTSLLWPLGHSGKLSPRVFHRVL